MPSVLSQQRAFVPAERVKRLRQRPEERLQVCATSAVHGGAHEVDARVHDLLEEVDALHHAAGRQQAVAQRLHAGSRASRETAHDVQGQRLDNVLVDNSRFVVGLAVFFRALECLRHSFGALQAMARADLIEVVRDRAAFDGFAFFIERSDGVDLRARDTQTIFQVLVHALEEIVQCLGDALEVTVDTVRGRLRLFIHERHELVGVPLFEAIAVVGVRLNYIAFALHFAGMFDVRFPQGFAQRGPINLRAPLLVEHDVTQLVRDQGADRSVADDIDFIAFSVVLRGIHFVAEDNQVVRPALEHASQHLFIRIPHIVKR